jgi:sulfate permease, SulP family
LQLTESRQDSTPGAVQSALLGAVLAVDGVGHCLAMATIFFAGALSAGLGIATAAFLAASVIMTLMLYAFSPLRPALGIAQDTSVAILAPAVAAAALATGDLQSQVATAFAAIGTASIMSGLVFWVAGRMRLGSLLRMFPYPVAAGFLASSGFILIYSGFAILTEATRYADIATNLTEPHVMWSVLAAAVMAIILIGVMRHPAGPRLVIFVILAFVAGFYLFLYSAGMDHAAAVALGVLPELGTTGPLVPGPWLFSAIDWAQVATLSLTFCAVVILNLLAVLLNTSGVEIALRQTVNENRELQTTGLTNLLIGAFGGTTSFLQGGATILAARLQVQRGAFTAGHVGVMLLACLYAPQIVAVVPTFVAAGVLMFIGLSMLEDWLVAARRRMILQDWLIVVGILAVTITVGILPAIGVGLALAILTFVAGFMRLPIIRAAHTAATRRSILDRTVTEAALLGQHGGRIQILQLQGALFFGSVEQMINRLGHLGRDTQALIVDFAEVSTFDSSACAAMQKLGNLMGAQGVDVHLTGMSAQLHSVFARWGLDLGGMFKVWPTLDAALEVCETRLLQDVGADTEAQPDLLLTLGDGHPRMDALLELMETLELAEGQALLRAQDTCRDVFFLESGRLGVYLPRGTAVPLLVRAMGPGAVVGEMASLLGQARSADVVAQMPSRVRRLSVAARERIEADDRDLAALLAMILARSLAIKVTQTNALLARGQENRT